MDRWSLLFFRTCLGYRLPWALSCTPASSDFRGLIDLQRLACFSSGLLATLHCAIQTTSSPSLHASLTGYLLFFLLLRRHWSPLDDAMRIQPNPTQTNPTQLNYFMFRARARAGASSSSETFNIEHRASNITYHIEHQSCSVVDWDNTPEAWRKWVPVLAFKYLPKECASHRIYGTHTTVNCTSRVQSNVKLVFEILAVVVGYDPKPYIHICIFMYITIYMIYFRSMYILRESYTLRK